MEELLKRVEGAGKRSVRAQLEDARLIGCSDGVATLLFRRETIRDRVAQDEIRKWVEAILTQMLAVPTRIECVTEKTQTRTKPASSVQGEVETSIPDSVLKVQQVFGGQITKIKEE